MWQGQRGRGRRREEDEVSCHFVQEVSWSKDNEGLCFGELVL